ncbi:MAG: TonB-dependent receptor plug domain-containing protein, partial [Steroidobacteraceae bacterium]
ARTILVSALACLALTLAQTAGAQSPRPEHTSSKEYSLNVDEQPLTRALEQLYAQTNVFYGYSPNSPEEEAMIVGPLRGKFTIEDALTKLLSKTDLTFTWTNSKQISIVRKPPAPKVKVSPQAKVPRTAQRPVRRDVAQEQDEDKILDTVTTERSRLTLLKDSATSFVILDRKAIERSGYMTVSDLLKYLPQQPYLRPDGYSSTGAQYAELRGLGADTTLVLITGHRAFASAASFAVNAFDLNTIPLSAVERVEVLFDSTSVRHGMDAIGGVLNVVLRDEIRQPSAQVHYGAAQGGSGLFQTSASAGYVVDGAKAAVMADYTTSQTLLGVEREFWANQDYRRYGSVDQRSINSSPANITSVLPENLPGLSSPIAAIPERIAGERIALSEFLAGQRNFESLLQFVPIVPATTRASVIANGEVELWPNDVVASAEVMYV